MAKKKAARKKAAKKKKATATKSTPTRIIKDKPGTIVAEVPSDG